MKITKTNCNFEREPLIAPFGFKGGYLSELWQSVVMLENDKGQSGIGLGTQIEEPFPEEYKEDVSDIPVCLAADESAHSDKDVAERIKLGYKAVTEAPGYWENPHIIGI